MVELVDVQEWAQPFSEFELPIPTQRRGYGFGRKRICRHPNGDLRGLDGLDHQLGRPAVRGESDFLPRLIETDGRAIGEDTALRSRTDPD